MDIFGDNLDLFDDLLGDPPVAPRPKVGLRKTRKVREPKAQEPIDPPACPLFKADAGMHCRPTQLFAPERCKTAADVVKAFNADADFAFCDLASPNHMMAANRTELWGQGFRVFLVRYHNGERLMGIAPVGRAR
jgi:hypothetical protein